MVNLELPVCLRQDEVEIQFGFDLHSILDSRKLSDLEERWGNICTTEISAWFTSEEAASFQEKLVENTLLGLMNGRPLGAQELEKVRDRVLFSSSPSCVRPGSPWVMP